MAPHGRPRKLGVTLERQAIIGGVMAVADHNEVHVCNAENGHHLSIDCWCEPVSIRWLTNKYGIRVLVVEHCDDTLKHHLEVLMERERDKTVPFLGNFVDLPINRGPNAPWITRTLTFKPPDPPQQQLPLDPFGL